MKPLIVLAVVFVISLALVRILSGSMDYVLPGNIAMSAMLLFTATGHFAFPEGMSMMLPVFIPFKKAIVYITGLVEIAAAAGLLLTAYRHVTALLLIIFFLLILPANIYAAIQQVDFQKADHSGPGKKYLWFRVPLQVFFIAWVYYFSV